MLIAGCGYVGTALAESLVRDGHEVWGLRRGASALPEGVRPVAADVALPETLRGVPSGLDVIVYAVAPPERSEAAYRLAYVDGLSNVLAAAGRDAPFRGRLVLVSSTGVYGESDGGWVDEDTEPRPTSATGRVLLEGERLALGFEGTGVVLRLGGIYGPGRDRTVRHVVSGEAVCPEPGSYGNRIHRDDAAGAARHLANLDVPDAVYLGVDRDPEELRAVYRWVAARTGAPDPCAGRHDPEQARARRGTNKRCSSDRLVASGYEFVYPSFRQGYEALLPS